MRFFIYTTDEILSLGVNKYNDFETNVLPAFYGDNAHFCHTRKYINLKKKKIPKGYKIMSSLAHRYFFS